MATIGPIPEGFPYPPRAQRLEGLRFVVQQVGTKRLLTSLGRLVYLDFMDPRVSNDIWNMIEEISNEYT